MKLLPAEHLVLAACRAHAFTPISFEKLKKRHAKGSQDGCPSNVSLLQAYQSLVKKGMLGENECFFNLLQKQSMRTLSGISSITVITKPYPCPGNCLYCPSEPGMPKSYLSNEPAVMRAVLTNFDPARQMKARIDSLHLTGHQTEKIELIVLGGTFSFYPKKYASWFIKRCFDAANGRPSRTLVEAKRLNERAKNRIIGLTLETRPDMINAKEIFFMRELGATRVELGVQSIYDDILKKNRRGHGVEATIKATALLKDAGFKINYHLMPNLPGSTKAKDLAMFKKIFSSPDFMPDMIKLYPCVVTRDSDLARLYRQKRYHPYSDRELIDLIVKIKRLTPRYLRIMRLGRDIPATAIIGGNTMSNLRQVVNKEMVRRGWRCHCIRCREVRDQKITKQSLRLFINEYAAAGGREYFISYENKSRTILYSLLRLRIPSFYFNKKTAPAIEVLRDCAIIREVHTYGESLRINKRKTRASQHQGLGKKLIKNAEQIASKKYGLTKIAVISGVGARGYYRKLGYRLQNEYMIKKLK